MHFPPDAAAVHTARRYVRDCLASQGLASFTAEMIVSELMANVIRHAGSPVTVSVHVGHSIRIEVHDDSRALPSIMEADEDAECGRGLAIVDALASRWGVRPTEAGKCVWVEMDPTSP